MFGGLVGFAWRLGDELQRRNAENAEVSAELMPRRRRGGMGWETRRTELERSMMKKAMLGKLWSLFFLVPRARRRA